MKKGSPCDPLSCLLSKGLLQLHFLVGHVLACLRIELHQFELFRRRLLVLVGRVEMTGAGARLELDLFASTFCHDRLLKVLQISPRARRSATTCSMPTLSISRSAALLM